MVKLADFMSIATIILYIELYIAVFIIIFVK